MKGGGSHLFKLSKTTQNALAALTYLAEHSSATRSVSSLEISQSRNLPQPVVAKTLTVLSQAGLVSGTPGPRGGYRLSRAPGSITLLEITEVFERENDTLCPYGPGWCGVGEPCPLHDSMSALREVVRDYLARTTLEIFHTSETAAGGSSRAGSGRPRSSATAPRRKGSRRR